jgi:hypothetical protein
LVRVRQPDRKDDASRRVAPETGHDLGFWNKFCSSELPSRVQDACDPRGCSGRIQRAAVSDEIHSPRLYGPATLVGSYRPNVPPHRFSRDFRRKFFRNSSSGIERPLGFPTRIAHPGRRVMILWQSRRLYGCWPLKGASSQPVKIKANDLWGTTRPIWTTEARVKHTPGTVKLFLPRWQSRGISQRIRSRAYEIYLERGEQSGRELDD